MIKKPMIILIPVFVFFIFAGIVEAVTIITFEDLPGIIWGPDYYNQHEHDGETGPMPENFAGFSWQNFYWNDSTLDYSTGYALGAVSGVYEAYNGRGLPCSIAANPFYFDGAYFTAAWNQDLSLNIQGYLEGAMQWEETLLLDATGPNWFGFSHTGLVDQLAFNSYGGIPYWIETSATQFVMDDFTVSTTPIPEPATILLIGSGLIGLSGFRRMMMNQKNR